MERRDVVIAGAGPAGLALAEPLAQRGYAIANPGAKVGYSDSLWGLTASDGPDGYNARGAPPAQNDDGTITPK